MSTEFKPTSNAIVLLASIAAAGSCMGLVFSVVNTWKMHIRAKREIALMNVVSTLFVQGVKLRSK
jgi:hypothetical protein